jgi:hypothetical protein
MTPQEKRISLHLCRIDSKWRGWYLYPTFKSMALQNYSCKTNLDRARVFAKMVKSIGICMPVQRKSRPGDYGEWILDSKLGNPADA